MAVLSIVISIFVLLLCLVKIIVLCDDIRVMRKKYDDDICNLWSAINEIEIERAKKVSF